MIPNPPRHCPRPPVAALFAVAMAILACNTPPARGEEAAASAPASAASSAESAHARSHAETMRRTHLVRLQEHLE